MSVLVRDFMGMRDESLGYGVYGYESLGDGAYGYESLGDGVYGS